MPIFEDINYEIQDQAMFNAAKECRDYISKHGIKHLDMKIFNMGKKYNVPYRRYEQGYSTLYYHMKNVRLLEDNKKSVPSPKRFEGAIEHGEVQQALIPKEKPIMKPSFGVSIFADTIEEIDAIETGLDTDVVVCTSKLFNRIYPVNTTLIGTRLDYHSVRLFDKRPVDVKAQEAIDKFMALTYEQKIEYIKQCKS